MSMSMSMSRIIVLLITLVGNYSYATRVKDIANIRGVRDNQIVGYGIVVGLKGTGDGKLEYTNKSVKRMLETLGMKLNGDEVSSQNVAAVLVTAKLPPFARAGNRVDVQVSSLGDASSLSGGTLIQTPLRASDQQIYAVAQGSVVIGSNGHSTSGSISNGALIEKDLLDEDFNGKKMYRFTLHNPDFVTAARLAKTINMDLGGKYANPLDPSTVDLIVPFHWEGKGVELLATIEGLEIEPDNKAKVIINEKTGTVIIGERVKIGTVAISHGDIAVSVGANGVRGLASAGAGGKSKGPVEKVNILDGSTSVGELVKGLNQLGVSPKDLITILQNIKASGALQGELEIL